MNPRGIATDEAGNLFIADTGNYRVRRVAPSNIIRTVAGNGLEAYSGDGGPATEAAVRPQDVAVDPGGNLLIADRDNHRVRRVSPSGIIQTAAGNGDPRFAGDGGPATSASIRWPAHVALDAAGNLFVSHESDNVARVSLDGTLRAFAGNGRSGSSGAGGPALTSSLGLVTGLAVDRAGNLLSADASNSTVRTVIDGVIRTVVGNGRQRVFG